MAQFPVGANNAKDRFRKLRGHRDMKVLMAALQRHVDPSIATDRKVA